MKRAESPISGRIATFEMLCSAMFVVHLVIVGILLIWLGTLLVNLCIFRRAPTRTAADLVDPPLVSILVPARDEEHRLAPCLDSLLAQDYPNREILVLDDHSTDRTGELVLARGFQESAAGPLRLLRGTELPAGWTGKGWACWQLAQAARGEFILFTDADTWHPPSGLSTAVAQARAERIDLFSAWPEQITETWSERLIIPLIWLLIAVFMPHFWLWLPLRSPWFARKVPRKAMWSLGGSNGQYMLFRRASYFAIGGHEAVRDHLVEDVALGRRMAERFGDGLRLLNCDGANVVRCRMYRSFPELWEGFTKNIRAAFDTRVGAFVGFGLMQVVCFVLPFFALPFAFGEAWWGKWVIAECALVWLMRIILTIRFSTSWLSCALHPVAHTLAVAIGLNSWRLSKKRGVTWKGRTYTMGETA